MKTKKTAAENRQKFLLTFFDKDKYTVKEINGFFLVKQYNGEKNNWQVAIYTKENWDKAVPYKKNYKMMLWRNNETKGIK